MKYKLSDVIEINKFQNIMENFSLATEITIAVLDLEGRILVASGWKDICTKFHRIHPETSKRCTESDTALASQLQEGKTYNVYQCLNGLVDVAVPIKIGGEHVGNFFTGQFLSEPPDLEFFRQQASKYGFDEDNYLGALFEVPVFSEEQVKRVMAFLTGLAELIGEMGLTLIKSKQAEEEIGKLKEKLEKRKKEKEGKYLFFTLSDEFYGISILKVKEIIGMSPITPVPYAPNFIKGVINLRGRVIPIIDLRRRFDLPETEYNERTCIIVTELQRDSKNILTGMIVDTVSEVIYIRGENIEDVPKFALRLNTDYIFGMARVGDKIRVLINIENILGKEEISFLEKDI